MTSLLLKARISAVAKPKLFSTLPQPRMVRMRCSENVKTELDTDQDQAQKITDWVDPKDNSGEFKRGASVFRSFISKEKGAEYPPEKGRYHLFVSYACPWGEFPPCPTRCIAPDRIR